ncbi:MAG: hypothetical protein KAR06_10485 [Deltaproteobacteria bacterium]|nr:hypothetical protein [Deltaproteobacteria bacterium]
MGVIGALTGPASRALLVLNPWRYGIQTDIFSSFLFDLAKSESVAMEADITEHTIQDGSDIADHIHFNLFDGTLTGKVSNHSVYAPPRVPLLLTDRFKKAFDELERIWRAGKFVTVFAVMRKYEDVLISSLSMDRDPESGQAQEFIIGFKETKIVDPATGIVRASVDVDMTKPDNRQGVSTFNMGSS